MKIVKSDNLQSVQLLRGVAALTVMIFHTIGGDRPYLPKDNAVRMVFEYGWMGVEIFFIISGFIIPYSMYKNDYHLKDFKIFFMKRIVRIEPPYIVSIVFALILGWSNTWTTWYMGHEYKIDWWNVLGHIGYVNVLTGKPWLNVAYWTLAIEFEYYLLLSLMFLYRVGKISVFVFFTITILALAEVYVKHGEILLCISIATLFAIQYIKKVPKVFLFIGTISYSLYLTHGFILTRVMALSGRYISSSPSSVVPRLLLTMLLCILFAWIYYLLFEKPFQKISKRFMYSDSEER
jgi:peptidoglycan/LPS O-acetylase OafA/YrhL